MEDKLLSYYNRELAYIRHVGSDFAKANPKVAEQLRMTADSIDDPHVARLIESFAFLNARIRQKLDDDFPELSEALLSVLYPHYIAPIPSFSVVQLIPSDNLKEVFTIPRNTELETAPVNGEPCRFRTGYDTQLLPLQVSSAELVNHRRNAPPLSNKIGVQAVLRLTLEALGEKFSFASLAPLTLRFFLRGASQEMFALYDLIMSGTLKIALAKNQQDPNPIFLNLNCLRQVGLDIDEHILPYSPRSFLGYRLLTEYFAFPEKFLFFELTDLPLDQLDEEAEQFEIYFYLKKTNKDLEQYIDADNFALGCVPLINLFKHRTEPITITHTEPEYEIVPELQRHEAFEIYSIDAVTAIENDGTQIPYSPFYGIKHDQPQSPFWHATRRSAMPHDGITSEGSDLFISLVDLEFNPLTANDFALDIETTCCNRDLPNQLPFGGNQPYFQFSDFTAPISKIDCLIRPSPTYRLDQGRTIYWRLLSHLNLNKVSLTDTKEGCEALREILRLYNFADSVETRAIIDSVLSLQSKPILARDPSGQMHFCQGIEITLEIDEERFAGNSPFLFSSMLDHFFALYSNLNSFTKLIVKNKSKQKVLYECSARVGEQKLL
jgi:type VI secretion system protein ImpG